MDDSCLPFIIAFFTSRGKPRKRFERDHVVANPDGAAELPKETIGAVIGPYKLIERSGEGGNPVALAKPDSQCARRREVNRLSAYP
jgi:hypothetical protein